MDNQQERSTDLAFAAGVVVGEGCWTVSVPQQRGGRLTFRPIFTITMDDEVSMLRLVEIFEAHDLPAYINRTKRGSIVITAQGYHRVKKYAEVLIPYMTGRKQAVAMLVHEFIESRLDKAPKAPPSEEEIDLIAKIRELNGNRRHTLTVEILRDYTPSFGKHLSKKI